MKDIKKKIALVLILGAFFIFPLVLSTGSSTKPHSTIIPGTRSETLEVSDMLWSPDGTKVAFIKARECSLTGELWVADKIFNGTELLNKRLLCRGVATQGLEDWQGEEILFIRSPYTIRSGRNELWKIKEDGSDLVQITYTSTNGIKQSSRWKSLPWFSGTAAWGRFIPDTGLVYFAAHDGSGIYQSYVCNDDGTDDWQTVSAPENAFTVAMSPTGNKLLWGDADSANEPTTLRACNIDGSDRTTIKEFGGQIGVVVLEDGNTIAWSENGNIYSIKMDGSEESTVIEDEYNNQIISANPANGGSMVMVSDRADDGNAHLFKVNRDGTIIEQLTDGDFNDIFGLISPDGEYLMYMREPIQTNNNKRFTKTYELVIKKIQGEPEVRIFDIMACNVYVDYDFATVNEQHKFLISLVGAPGPMVPDLVDSIIAYGPNGYQVEFVNQEYNLENINGYILDPTSCWYMVNLKTGFLEEGYYNIVVSLKNGETISMGRYQNNTPQQTILSAYLANRDELYTSYDPGTTNPLDPSTPLTDIEVSWTTLKDVADVDAYYIYRISEGSTSEEFDIQNLVWWDNVFLQQYIDTVIYGLPYSTYALNKAGVTIGVPLEAGKDYAYFVETTDSNKMGDTNICIFQPHQLFSTVPTPQIYDIMACNVYVDYDFATVSEQHKFLVAFYPMPGVFIPDLVESIVAYGPNGYQVEFVNQEYNLDNINGYITDEAFGSCWYMVNLKTGYMEEGYYEIVVTYKNGETVSMGRYQDNSPQDELVGAYLANKDELYTSFTPGTNNPMLPTDSVVDVNVSWNTLKDVAGVDSYNIYRISEGSTSEEFDIQNLVWWDNVFVNRIYVDPEYGLNKGSVIVGETLEAGIDYAYFVETTDSNKMGDTNICIFQPHQLFTTPNPRMYDIMACNVYVDYDFATVNEQHKFLVAFYPMPGVFIPDVVDSIVAYGPNGYTVEFANQEYNLDNINGYITDEAAGSCWYMINLKTGFMEEGEYTIVVTYNNGETQLISRIQENAPQIAMLDAYLANKETLYDSFTPGTINPLSIDTPLTNIPVSWLTLNDVAPGVDSYNIFRISEGSTSEEFDIQNLVWWDNVFINRIYVDPEYGLNKGSLTIGNAYNPVKLNPDTDYAYFVETTDSNKMGDTNICIFQPHQLFSTPPTPRIFDIMACNVYVDYEFATVNEQHKFLISLVGAGEYFIPDLVDTIIAYGPNGYQVEFINQLYDLENINGYILDPTSCWYMVNLKTGFMEEGYYNIVVTLKNGETISMGRYQNNTPQEAILGAYLANRDVLYASYSPGTLNPKVPGTPLTDVEVSWTTLKDIADVDAYYIYRISEGSTPEEFDIQNLVWWDNVFYYQYIDTVIYGLPYSTYALNKGGVTIGTTLEADTSYAYFVEITNSNKMGTTDICIFSPHQVFTTPIV